MHQRGFFMSNFMKIELNGNAMHIADDAMLIDVVAQLQLPEQGVAIAVNHSIVTRSEWANYPLKQEDSILIINAAYGG